MLNFGKNIFKAYFKNDTLIDEISKNDKKSEKESECLI